MQKFKKIAIALALVVLAGAGYFMATSDGEAKATPQSDFYSYVNAKWLKETKLTEDKTVIGNMSELQEKTTDKVKESFEENLGGIGAVIAHEVSHAFDNSGAQFDEKGNLANWWKEEEYKNFQETVKKAADMYSKLEVLPGYFVNGEISTGEIAADLGGLTIAIDIAKEKGLDTKKVFESYAQVWREKKTDE